MKKKIVYKVVWPRNERLYSYAYGLIPYNTVVEYKKDELIAWRHLGRWRWRYELKDLGNGSTQVTETFDGTYAPALAQTWLNFRKAYPWTQLAVAKSLVRLKAVAESEGR